MRVPVTVVAGFSGRYKSALISQWRAQPLAPAALLIDRGDDFKFPRERATAVAPDPLVERIGGCVCCSASMALGGAVRRLRRQGAWSNLVVDLNAGAHPAAFIDALRAPALSGAVGVAEIASVIDAARLPQHLAGSQRRWIFEQVRCAYRVLVCCPQAMPHTEIDAHCQSVRMLAGHDRFGPEILVWREGEPPPAPWAAAPSDPVASIARDAVGAVVQLQALPGALSEGVRAASDGVPGPRWRWLWRVSPDQVFERARLAEVLGGWAGAVQGIEAVLRTERDWYRFDRDRYEPDVWRRDSRVQITFDANALPGMRAALARLAHDLSACRQGA